MKPGEDPRPDQTERKHPYPDTGESKPYPSTDAGGKQAETKRVPPQEEKK